MDPVKLYHPDGRSYFVDTKAEEVQLRAQGYTDEPPAERTDEELAADHESVDVTVNPPAPVVDIQHPENYTVEQLAGFVKEHPELGAAVAKAEQARPKDERRSTVLALG